MNKNKKIQMMNKNCQNTMVSAVGIEITDIGDNYICGKMPIDKRTIQPFGLLHGGASVTLSETLGSLGAGTKVDLKTQSVVGVEINANHLNSINSGWVYGKAVPIKVGKRIQVWDINILDEDSKLISISRLTLAVINKE